VKGDLPQRKLGRKRARTDRVEVRKPQDVVGPEALANPGAAALSEHCSLENHPPRVNPIQAEPIQGRSGSILRKDNRNVLTESSDKARFALRGMDGGNRSRSDKAKKGRRLGRRQRKDSAGIMKKLQREFQRPADQVVVAIEALGHDNPELSEGPVGQSAEQAVETVRRLPERATKLLDKVGSCSNAQG
jgi:hypothetical protein